jgi:hypothetical protein
MCFSATASFTAGAVLTTIGIVSIRKSPSASQTMFAGIPFIFGIQQITEGFVWLSLTDTSFAFLKSLATYNFLFFAQVVWPMWVPLSIVRLEPKHKRRTAEIFLVYLGALMSVYQLFCLFTFHVYSVVQDHHILYVQDYPVIISHFSKAIYLCVIFLPLFLSRIAHMKLLGTVIVISCVVSLLVYRIYFVSVWCFFAAVVSFIVYIIVHTISHTERPVPFHLKRT